MAVKKEREKRPKRVYRAGSEWVIPKVERYGLEKYVIEMEGQHPQSEIADVCNKILVDRNVDDKITQVAIGRYIKKLRGMRAETAKKVWQTNVEPTIRGACERMNKIEDDAFRRYEVSTTDKDRLLWARELRETIKLKFSYAGLQDSPENTARELQEGIEKELGPELFSKVEKIMQQRVKKADVEAVIRETEDAPGVH